MLRPSPVVGTPRLSWRGVGWLLLYAVALGASHYFVVAPKFGYLGFEQIPPNLALAVLLAVPYVLCARRLPTSWERPSAIVYWMLFLVVVAPVHVLPVFVSDPTSATWTMVSSIALAFWLMGLMYSVRPPRIPRFQIPSRIYWIGYIVLWVGLFGLIVMHYGAHLRLVSLSEIYQIRDMFKEQSANAPMITRYGISWLGNVIAPIAIARGLMKKRWWWVAAGVFTELFLVSLTGFKQLMFSFVLVTIVVLLVKYTDVSKLGRRFATLTAVGVSAVTIVDYVTSQVSFLSSVPMNGVASSLLVRRMILTAAVNTHYYFEFFSDHPHALLAQSIFGHFFDYPYGLTPALLLGLVYYGNPNMSANANIWADAYANFGVAGVFAFTLVLALALLVVDGVTKDLAPGIGLGALALSSFSFTNTAMLTVFLTHGFLLAVALLYFMPTAGSEATGRASLSGADPPHVRLRRPTGGARRARHTRRPDRETSAGGNRGPLSPVGSSETPSVDGVGRRVLEHDAARDGMQP